MKRIFLICCCIGLSLSVSFAQQDKIDSLEKKMETAADSDLFDIYYALVYYYQYVSQEKTLEYLEKSLEVAKKEGNNSRQNDVYRDLGGFYDRIHEDSLSIHYYTLALNNFEKEENYEAVAMTYQSLGNFYWKRSKWMEATDNYLMSLSVSEEHHDSVGMAKAYNSLAFVFDRTEEYDKALEFYKKGLYYWRKTGNNSGLAVSLNNIGNIYKQIDEGEKALKYYFMSLEHKTGYYDKESKDIVFYNIGEIYLELDKYDSALYYLGKGMHNSKFYNDEHTLSYIYHMTGKVFLELKNQDSAYYYLNLARYVAEKTHCDEILKFIYKSLDVYYYEEGNIDSAYHYLREHLIISDSLRPDQARSKVARFESERFQARLDLLEKEKEISELKSQRRATLLKFAVITALLILVLLIMIYSRFVLKQRTNRLLADTNAKLEEANLTKNRFFAIISHDLKNNLIAFQNISELLTENFDKIAEEKKQHLLVRLTKSSTKLNNMLSNLLLWSKSQLEYIDFKPERFHISGLITDICDNQEEYAVNKNIKVRKNISNDSEVVGDPEMIRIVIRNLLNNALKFSGENTTVELFEKHHENQYVFGVRDEGEGISVEEQKGLFEIGKDAGNELSSKTKDKGAGLGLIICKEFIIRHGGSLWVESEEQKGSTFYFSIPKQD